LAAMIALGLKPELIMDDQLLRIVYHRLFNSGKVPHPFNCIYSDATIAMIHLLAVLRDRSMRWAHDRRNWPIWMRRLPRPSYSQLMRRLQRPSLQQLIAQISREYRDQLPHSAEKFCDGKPLVVGGFSKDPDVDRGKLPGEGWGRGYKVHVIVDSCGAIEAFAVTSLSAGESTTMRKLVKTAALDGVILRADSNYDSNKLYRAVARRKGRLIASRKKPGTGLGHTKHHPDRLKAIEELERTDEALRAHRRHRIRVEQTLGHLTNLPFGLSPLPNCVRRKKRVTQWVTSKILFYHLYLSLQKTKALAA